MNTRARRPTSRTVALLIPRVARTMRWIPLTAGGPVAFWIVYMGMHTERPTGNVQLPLAGALVCATLAFLLDDEAARTVASAPTPLVMRRSIRVALAMPVAWAMWAVLAWYAKDLAAAPAVEFAGLLALTAALATIGAAILREERAGLFASPALLLLLGASAVVTPKWRPFPVVPISSTWFDLYGRWGLVLVVSIAVFLIASVDPARRRPIRMVINGFVHGWPRHVRRAIVSERLAR